MLFNIIGNAASLPIWRNNNIFKRYIDLNGVIEIESQTYS